MTKIDPAWRHEASILHADMDSFFVSVELLERPDLIGKPVASAFDGERSVVSSASYEARRFGVRSAMPVARAKQLCPHIVLIPPDMSKYAAASKQIMQIFREFTPFVEPISVDEAFLDVAGSVRLFGPPVEIARQIRERVRERTGLPVSVGLAGTKFIAKLASQRAKPDGLLEIPPAHTLEFLHPLPIGAMWGVGAATERALSGRAIHTVGELAREPLESLRRIVGNASAEKLHALANGRDVRSVNTTRVEKSIGHEETFAVDIADPVTLERELLRLSAKIGERLRDKGFVARTIAIKVRWSSFETVTRSKTLADPTDATQRIYRTAKDLFEEFGAARRPVRLIGVRAEQLSLGGGASTALWDDDEQWRAVDHAVDEVREKFAGLGLQPARLLGGRGKVVDPRSLRTPDDLT
ncbi:DNA polymerase IV [Leucobacter sp. cx-42]|uniref:DNA polymerase IV n=1 Tax=unclassified Leucobacter TaxID=2621730 RepID=UPI00165D993D|nr:MULTISPECIES: DNA polymerase IV [unclassified Leucobacter]MBC9953036.1 DNA polymerase IV [Leucobacter sp. cx-42]